MAEGTSCGLVKCEVHFTLPRMARDAAIRTSSHRQRPRGLRLGERLRQLRVAAGLTQSELAGDRFSKEYVSQIERGKTRPDARDGRVARGAARRRRRLPRERRRDRRAGAPRGCARTRGDAARGGHNDEARRRVRACSCPPPARRGCPSSRSRALLGAGRAQMRLGALRQALDLLNEARGIVEAASFSDLERAEVLHRARRLPLPAEQHPDLARPAERGARARRALRAAVRLAALEHPLVALPLLAPPARLRGRTRGHRARAPARRGRRTTRARSAPRTSRRRSSPTAKGTGSSRGRMRRRRAPRTRSCPTACTSASSRTTSAA